MTNANKPSFNVVSCQTVEDDCYTFSIQQLSISSGPCRSPQEARDNVFREIRAWAQSLSPENHALVRNENADIPSQHQRLEYVREIKPGAGAPILKRLVEKYGQMSNTELAETIGLVDECKVSSSTFSNALAGRGSRLVRVMIALALDEQPSLLWPFLSLKVRIADDEVYFGTQGGKLQQQQC